MGIQVAAIAKRYTLQMQAQAAKAQSADGTVQVGINLEKMMADQKATAEENIKAFWSGESRKLYFHAYS